MENAGYETEGKDSTKKLVSHDADDFDWLL
jgi:hypothetical protein